MSSCLTPAWPLTALKPPYPHSCILPARSSSLMLCLYDQNWGLPCYFYIICPHIQLFFDCVFPSASRRNYNNFLFLNVFYFIFKLLYCCSITVVCIFSPPLYYNFLNSEVHFRFLKIFIYLFFQRGIGSKREREASMCERETSVCRSHASQLGTSLQLRCVLWPGIEPETFPLWDHAQPTKPCLSGLKYTFKMLF